MWHNHIEFEFDPMINLDTSIGYDPGITWIKVSGPNSGVIVDVTTEDDLKDKNAIFSFDTHPRISTDVTFGFILRGRNIEQWWKM